MTSIYQLTQDYISNAINVLRNGSYLNLTITMQVFRIVPKIVLQRLYKEALKSL